MWIKSETNVLQNALIDSRSFGKQVLRRYQASEVETQKWHLLNHLAESIKQVGRAEYLFGKMFEITHPSFQFTFRKPLCRKISEMKKVM